jgi:hypothetical protein
MTAAIKPSYRRTEAKYKGGAHEMYVTYDLEQRTRGDKTAVYPKAKRVYIAGEVRDWEVGDFQKKTGPYTFRNRRQEGRTQEADPQLL